MSAQNPPEDPVPEDPAPQDPGQDDETRVVNTGQPDLGRADATQIINTPQSVGPTSTPQPAPPTPQPPAPPTPPSTAQFPAGQNPAELPSGQFGPPPQGPPAQSTPAQFGPGQYGQPQPGAQFGQGQQFGQAPQFGQPGQAQFGQGQFGPGQYGPGPQVGQAQYPQGQFPGAAPAEKKSKTGLIATALGLVVLLAGGGLGYYGWQNGWFGGDAPVALAAGTMLVGTTGDNFAQSTQLSESDHAALVKSSGHSGGDVAGTENKLYAGSYDTLTCDGAALASYIADDSGRSAAFSQAANVSGDVKEYVMGLTSLVLAHDTAVTLTSFTDAGTQTDTAILQAGTPVLVDAHGVPKVRCTGAGALGAPPAEGLKYNKVDDQWSWYSPDAIVTVTPGSSEVTEFEALNLNTSSEDTTILVPVGILALDLKGTWGAVADWNDDPRVELVNDNAVRFDGTLTYGTSGTDSDCRYAFTENRREENVVYIDLKSGTRRALCLDFSAKMTVNDRNMSMTVVTAEDEDDPEPLEFTKE